MKGVLIMENIHLQKKFLLKRVLCVFLVVSIFFTSLPTTVFGVDEVELNNLSEIQNAINNAKSDITLKLGLKEVIGNPKVWTGTITIPEKIHITLHLR